MNHRYSIVILLTVVVFGCLFSGTQRAGVPWKNAETAAFDYMAVMKQRDQTTRTISVVIWDMVHGESAAEVQGLGFPVFVVPGHPGVLVEASPGPGGGLPADRGLASDIRIRTIDTDLQMPVLNFLPCANCREEERIVSYNRYPGPFLSRDLARVIYFKDGDLWMAEVDWPGSTVRNRRQVTQVGLFPGPGSYGFKLLHWHGQNVFFLGGFSQEKPIVKVDLESGDVEELPRMHIFGDEMFASPGGRFLLASMEEILNCYDVESGETFRISLQSVLDESRLPVSLRRYQGHLFKASGGSGSGARGNIRWLDDHRAISWLSGAGLIAVVDFEQRTVNTIHAAKPPEHSRLQLKAVELLPGREHVFMFAQSTQSSRQVTYRISRISLTDGSAVDLPEELIDSRKRLRRIVWLDSDRYLFTKDRGGLTEIGTWVHDLKSGESRRICPSPANIDTRRGRSSVPYNAESQIVYFMSRAQGGGIFRVDLGSGSCEKIDAFDGLPRGLSDFGILPPGSISAEVLTSLGGK